MKPDSQSYDASNDQLVSDDKLMALMSYCHSMGMYVSVMRREDRWRAFGFKGYVTIPYSAAAIADHPTSPATALTAMIRIALKKIENKDEFWS